MSLNLLKQARNFRVSYVLLMVLTLNPNTEAALFDGCDYKYSLNRGISYLESPYYPNSYPPGTSCRYEFVAPLDYGISINCSLNLDKGSDACSTEFFYVAKDGDRLLRDSEQLCGSGIIFRRSLFDSIVLAYVSGGSHGKFHCELSVQPQPCDCGWSVNTKIVNGQETAVNEFPSMVALRDTSTNLQSFCGGAIISHRHIVSAAHCAATQPNAIYLQALVGYHNLNADSNTKYAAIYDISQIIVHPQYTANPVNNDIAIYVTKTNIRWSRGVGPICLPPLANANADFAYTYVDIIGWGTTSFAGPTSDTLQKISLLVTDQQTCIETYANDATIYPTQMCTYDYSGSSKDSCQYDSGGPVILRTTRQFLLGTVSFGKICGQNGYATGVNTRITSYLNWIYQITGYRTCNKKLFP